MYAVGGGGVLGGKRQCTMLCYAMLRFVRLNSGAHYTYEYELLD